MDSIRLDREFVTDIGQYLENLWHSDSLYMGMTFATLKSSEKYPVFTEILIQAFQWLYHCRSYIFEDFIWDKVISIEWLWLHLIKKLRNLIFDNSENWKFCGFGEFRKSVKCLSFFGVSIISEILWELFSVSPLGAKYFPHLFPGWLKGNLH